MRAVEQQPYLEAVDAALADRGYRRTKRSQEWSRRDGSDRLWLHLNFGRALLQLTVGVEYRDVQEAWESLPGGVFSTSESPQEGLSSSDSAERVAEFVRDVAVARLVELRDRNWVIDRLLGSDVRSWPTISFSHRIRLLPVLLVDRCRRLEALEFCRSIGTDDLLRDQIRPPFNEFRDALEASLAN